eukprot:6198313-Pleurochrysis_carterae.AAC.1
MTVRQHASCMKAESVRLETEAKAVMSAIHLSARFCEGRGGGHGDGRRGGSVSRHSRGRDMPR